MRVRWFRIHHGSRFTNGPANRRAVKQKNPPFCGGFRKELFNRHLILELRAGTIGLCQDEMPAGAPGGTIDGIDMAKFKIIVREPCFIRLRVSNEELSGRVVRTDHWKKPIRKGRFRMEKPATCNL
jgi:hypothetical protein